MLYHHIRVTDEFRSPIFGGWLADAHHGHFRTMCVGVTICSVIHVIMIISAVPSIIQVGHAIGPFALSLYMLTIGATMSKYNTASTILDQNPHKGPCCYKERWNQSYYRPRSHHRTCPALVCYFAHSGLNLANCQRFYLLINIGAFLGVATAYLAKDNRLLGCLPPPRHHLIHAPRPPLLCQQAPRQDAYRRICPGPLHLRQHACSCEKPGSAVLVARSIGTASDLLSWLLTATPKSIPGMTSSSRMLAELWALVQSSNYFLFSKSMTAVLELLPTLSLLL